MRDLKRVWFVATVVGSLACLTAGCDDGAFEVRAMPLSGSAGGQGGGAASDVPEQPAIMR